MLELLAAEGTEREVRSIAYQMIAARFPAHRDLSGFDFTQSKRNYILDKPISISDNAVIGDRHEQLKRTPLPRRR